MDLIGVYVLHRSQATGEEKRGLCCVRTMKRDTLNSASDQMKYPSPTLSQILFLHIMIHSAKAKTITTEDISCQSQPPFFGQLF